VAKRTVKNLSKIDWAFINFKVALGLVWTSAYFQSRTAARPEGADNGLFLGVWALTTIVGFLISITGLFMAAQGEHWKMLGYRIEISGLWLFGAGPGVYAIIMAWMMFTNPEQIRLAQISLCYALCAAVAARILIVRQGAIRELKIRAVGD
jgi:hypothetical protein